MAAILLIVASGDDAQIRRAVEAFAAAARADGQPGLAATMCAEEAELLVPEEPGQTWPEPPESGVITQRVEVRGEVAAADVELPGGGQVTLYLLREGGAWKVCSPARERFDAAPPG